MTSKNIGTDNKKIVLTKNGLETLKKEYEMLTKKQRPQILEEIRNARILGDLSENGMYSAARDKQSFLEGRVSEIESILKKATIIGTRIGKQSLVEIGATVTLEFQSQKIVYSIVGAEEVDFASRKISHESPLGKALIGKRIGDIIKVDAPVGVVKYKVLDIS